MGFSVYIGQSAPTPPLNCTNFMKLLQANEMPPLPLWRLILLDTIPFQLEIKATQTTSLLNRLDINSISIFL